MTADHTKPFFSVVIPTYNRKDLLSQTLDTLCVQSYLDYEVIVIDDGGTDDTREMILLRKDLRIRYFHINNCERGAARNSGVREANGRYVTFLDSDDIAYPDLLENAKNAIDRFDLPPLLHCGYQIKTTKGKINYSYDRLRSDDKKMLVKGNPLSCIGVFIRRDIAVLFPFNEDRELSGSEDWELWLRLVANHGIKTDNHISSAIINHPDRSVKHTDPEKLYKRKELALKYSFADPKVKEVYSRFHRQIESFADSYISLHLALSGYRMLAMKYLIRSIFLYPPIVFNRRAFAISKRILLGK